MSGREEGGGGISSSEVSLEVRAERCDRTRKSINTGILVGDQNSCYRGLGCWKQIEVRICKCVSVCV